MQKKKGQSKRQDLLRPLLWVLATVLVLIVVFSAVFYGQFEEILMDRTHAYVAGALQQAAALGDKMMQEVTKLCMQMYSGGLIDLFSFSKDPNDYYVLDALQKMDNYRFLSSYIHSVYVYSRIQQRVYLSATHITNKVQPASTFFDAGALALLTDHPDLTPLLPIARSIPVETTGESYNGLTFVFFDYALVENSNTIMFVNVDKTMLTKAWNAIGNSTHASILALHPEAGITIDMGNALERSPDIAEILPQVSASSTFQTFKTKRQRLYVAATPTAQNGWQYIGILTEDALSGDLKGLRAKTLSIAMWILLIGTAVGGVSAFRMARPLRTLREKVTTLEMDQAKDVQQLRRSALRRMLLSCKEQLPTSEMERLNLCGGTDCMYRVLLLNNIQSVTLLQTDRTSALSAAVEQTDTSLRGLYAVPMGHKSIAILMVHTDDDSSVAEKAEQLLKTINPVEEWKFTAALSTASQSLEELSFLYNQAAQYMIYSLFGHPTRIIYVEQEMQRNPADASYPVKIEKVMCDAITNAHFETAAEECTQLLSALEQLPPMKLNMASTHLLFNIGNAIETFRINMLPDLALNYNLDHLFTESSSITDVENRLLAVFHELTVLHEKNRNVRSDQFVAKINAILNAEYCNSAFSLNMIAEIMGLTPNYIGRMYKRATGSSIPDKIMNLRIERACMLLVTTRLSVAQIAEDVGFTGEGYFYKAFKKHNSCTPNDYKRNHRDLSTDDK